MCSQLKQARMRNYSFLLNAVKKQKTINIDEFPFIENDICKSAQYPSQMS